MGGGAGRGGLGRAKVQDTKSDSIVSLMTFKSYYNTLTPSYFSPLSEIPGSIELLENSLTYEGVQWRKVVEC